MRFAVLFAMILFLSACRRNKENVCRIVVQMQGTSADSVMMRGISNGHTGLVSSGLLRFSRDSLVFEVPLSTDSLYLFSLKYSRNRVYCIPDRSDIRIIMNKKNGKDTIYGSPTSLSLLQFNEIQDSLMQLAGQLADSVPEKFSQIKNLIQQRYVHYADTVSSSAAFILNYDRMQLGDDFKQMKILVTRATERFPNSPSIRRINEDLAKLVHIHEFEWGLGSVFPDLRLPDLEDHMFSTLSLRGNYVFIDFWSSWCEKCLEYGKIKKDLSEQAKFKNLDLVSIAMDDNLETCRELILRNKIPGIHLIDRDMWQGKTAALIAFDSIPFNFLLGPDQRILAKAIPADSVMAVLSRLIK